MSSPYLNNIIIVGCLFSYTSIFFLGEYDGITNKFIVNNICLVKKIYYKIKVSLKNLNLIFKDKSLVSNYWFYIGVRSYVQQNV